LYNIHTIAGLDCLLSRNITVRSTAHISHAIKNCCYQNILTGSNIRHNSTLHDTSTISLHGDVLPYPYRLVVTVGDN